MAKSAAIIIGASSGLGSAICEQWQRDATIDAVIAISRKNIKYKISVKEARDNSKILHSIQCDYTESAIKNCCEQVDELMQRYRLDNVTRVCICNGILHNDDVWPEKRIEEIDSKMLLEVFSINAVIPVLWLKALLKIVKGDTECIMTVFNARIGSISDNRSGGWYSYRASKAALNMLLKTAAIEYARRAKNVKLISFHPGTTDTPLSKPFQHSIDADSLFTAGFVAKHLVDLMNLKHADGELSFIDWEDKPIAW